MKLFSIHIILCTSNDIILSQYLRFLTKSGTSGNRAVTELLDGKAAFEMKLQVLFPSVASGEHTYKLETIKPLTTFRWVKVKARHMFLWAACISCRRNAETELNRH